jgi:hypothetical protein
MREGWLFFRLLFGRRLRTDEAHTQRIGPVQGVPILGLDTLGSASYGPEAALTILIPAGAAGVASMPGIVGAFVLLLAILYFSYRQTIAAYPNGGGSYTRSERKPQQACQPLDRGHPPARLHSQCRGRHLSRGRCVGIRLSRTAGAHAGGLPRGAGRGCSVLRLRQPGGKKGDGSSEL